MVGKHIKDRAFQREKCWMCPKSRTKCWVVGVIIKEYIIYRSRTIYYNYKLHTYIYIYIYIYIHACDHVIVKPSGRLARGWLPLLSCLQGFQGLWSLAINGKPPASTRCQKWKWKWKESPCLPVTSPLFSLSFPLLSRLLFNFYVLFFLLSHSN